MGFSSNLTREVTTNASQGSTKRRRSLGDSDTAVNGVDQDEDSEDRVDLPPKLPNGNYKCSHLCRDRQRLDSFVPNVVTVP
jgi:hypothetical protein